MNRFMIIEIAGYVGSALVVVSMLMSSVVKLRVINAIGSVISATYALIIHSYPLALMNICLIVINIYNLSKLLKSEKEYGLVDVGADDAFLKYFFDYYKSDIKSFFPDADAEIQSADAAYVVCCDASPAGLLLGKKMEDGTLGVAIDYTTPAYRDCSVGEFLYSHLAEKGIGKLVYSKESAEHVPYLRKMGFDPEGGAYVKRLF